MIEIEYDNREVLGALSRLSRASSDLRPAMSAIADALVDVPEKSFESESSPNGDPWAVLSPHTRTKRAEQGKWPGQILQVGGHLAQSITSHFDSRTAVAGTDLDYARTHQYGADQGAFGTTRKTGRPIPFGDIPARPFLGCSDDLDEEILDILQRQVYHLGRFSRSKNS